MLNSISGPTALVVLLAAALASPSAFAQSGSAGGSIGNDEKSLSGSRSDRSAEPAPSARRSKPAAEEPRSSSRRSGGGGGGGGGGSGGFDGAWVVTSVGCGGSTSGAVVVSSGKVIGQGVSGTVSPSGAVRTFGQGDGVTFTGSGRLGARSGSGSWRRSDGCGGTWSSAKQ
ncbi:hypothetical protein C7U92_08465 [Bradyrhizobium sp. WBOS7]|uniref:Uncharacterized protein n=1 Tax=Bradyrhizobium betae TaxID=244734 RepID=A0AAE9NED5_9BRAD|nr:MULTISPECIES: hypothetical protein [Bradyrhizobium]MDD1570147.1 hypothetical protein [Bradyrhizobium sp. WBOS1]UUO36706.1 hypothetical protein DCK84_20480 [Bradyrhizobium sp. WBOS01]MDD1525884.1 hypothetical protein [Bradyrhizobium sp. WBOS2]MDD1576767.1 hypothetical protein [Bradyrhizobium sp. WBOS7]MDD1599079.1 hypothetical protein [Bradyrhizobium sp. WBOS16]